MKILLLIIPLLISCGKITAKKSSEVKQDVSPIYQSTELKVSVYYEEGAEPYTDELPVPAVNLKLWDLFQVNMNALLQGRSMAVTVPKTLPEMTKLSARNKSQWSIDDILGLAAANPVEAKGGVTHFQIFFVNGYAEQNSGIIGLHINNTKVMAIFKTVVKNSSNGDLFVPKYIEQATIIHEMGHALGLVNNGLPMKTSHQDSANGAHCSNPNCVMYYENEGAGSLINFVAKVKDDKNLIMFDSQCLEDARAFK